MALYSPFHRPAFLGIMVLGAMVLSWTTMVCQLTIQYQLADLFSWHSFKYYGDSLWQLTQRPVSTRFDLLWLGSQSIQTAASDWAQDRAGKLDMESKFDDISLGSLLWTSRQKVDHLSFGVQLLSRAQLFRLHGLQHARLPCPPLSPRVCSSSCPLIWRCHWTILSSVSLFSFYLQFFPASESFHWISSLHQVPKALELRL